MGVDMFKKKYFLDIYLVIAIFIILYTIVLSVTVFNKNKDLLNTQNQATYNHLLQQTQEEIDNSSLSAVT